MNVIDDDLDPIYPPPGPWRLHGACVGTDTNMWFPERGQPINHLRAICATCVVKAACLDYALASPSPLSGVWGGTSGKERLRMRRTLRLEVVA